MEFKCGIGFSLGSAQNEDNCLGGAATWSNAVDQLVGAAKRRASPPKDTPSKKMKMGTGQGGLVQKNAITAMNEVKSGIDLIMSITDQFWCLLESEPSWRCRCRM